MDYLFLFICIWVHSKADGYRNECCRCAFYSHRIVQPERFSSRGNFPCIRILRESPAWRHSIPGLNLTRRTSVGLV